MKNLIDDFKELLVMENSSPATIYNYDFILRHAEQFFSEHYGVTLTDNKLWRLNGSMIQAFVNDFESRGIADSTKIQYIRRMNRFLSWTYEMGYTKTNLSAALPKIKSIGKKASYREDRNDANLYADDEEDSRVYSDQDIVRMIAIASLNKNNLIAARDCAMIAMLAGTGLRASELASLNVRNIRRAEGRCIRVWRKGGKRGIVAIAEFAIPYLNNYLALRRNPADDEPLFLSTQNNRLSRCTIWQILSRIQKSANVQTGVHNFRHTVLTNIAKNNTTGVAAVIAGHSSSQITEKYYIHPDTEDREKVIDGLTLNEVLKPHRSVTKT